MSRKILFSYLCATFLISGIHLCFSSDMTFFYDDLHRLVRVEYGDGTFVEYAYDDVGGRIQKVYDNPIVAGDTDAGGTVELRDVILDLQIAAGMTPSVFIQKESDVSGDGKIGTEEAVFGIQVVSGTRN